MLLTILGKPILTAKTRMTDMNVVGMRFWLTEDESPANMPLALASL